MAEDIESQIISRLVEEWGQEIMDRVKSSTVTIITEGSAAKYVSTPLAGARFNNIRLISSSSLPDTETFWGIEMYVLSSMRSPRVMQKSTLDSGNATNSAGTRSELNTCIEREVLAAEDKSLARAYQRGLQTVNPSSNIVAVRSNLDNLCAATLLQGSQVIVDTTNNPQSKYWAMMYGRKHNVPVISMSSMPGYGKLALFIPGRDYVEDGWEGILHHNWDKTLDEYLMAEFAGKQHDPVIERYLGALACEEIKKIIAFNPQLQKALGIEDKESRLISLEKLELLDRPMYLKLGYPDMFSELKYGETPVPIDPADFAGKNILVIGAGAIGNPLLEQLIEIGVSRIDIMDNDHVSFSNLSRSPLYRESDVGRSKAQVAKAALQRILRQKGAEDKTEINAIHSTFGPGFSSEVRYDYVIGSVDNDYVRGELAVWALNNNVPYIHTGISISDLSVAIAVPGETECMDCLYDETYYTNAIRNYQQITQACGREPNPSNGWVAGLAASLACILMARAEHPDKYGGMPNLVIYGDMENYPTRVNFLGKDAPCQHHSEKQKTILERIPQHD